MATRRELMGGLVALLLSLTGTQALAQAPAAKSPAPKLLSSSPGLAVYPSKGQDAPQQQLATFNKSFGACLGGRGYSVK